MQEALKNETGTCYEQPVHCDSIGRLCDYAVVIENNQRWEEKQNSAAAANPDANPVGIFFPRAATNL